MDKTSRVIRHVAEMIADETDLYALLATLVQCTEDYRDATHLLKEIQTISKNHGDTLRTRFSEIGGLETDIRIGKQAAINVSDSFPVTMALTQTCAELNRLIIRYAMLRSIALRYRDSSLIGERNTGDLAEQHTKSYVGAVHRINQILHNAVLWEMDQDGEVCQCTCPSCGIGICMCAQGPRRTLSDIWAETGPISDEASVYVHLPRSGSAAEEAGLVSGDRILEAAGKKLNDHYILQGVVNACSAGEEITLHVENTVGEVRDVTIIRR